MQFRHQVQTPLASCGGSSAFPQWLGVLCSVFWKWMDFLRPWCGSNSTSETKHGTRSKNHWWCFIPWVGISFSLEDGFRWISLLATRFYIKPFDSLDCWLLGWEVGLGREASWLKGHVFEAPFRHPLPGLATIYLGTAQPSEGLWSVPKSERAHETLWMWTQNCAVQLQQFVNFLIAWLLLTTCFKQ